MSRSKPRPRPPYAATVAAAAWLARDATYGVSMVLVERADGRDVAQCAAERAGVDLTIESGESTLTVVFTPRHQDRVIDARTRGASPSPSGSLRSA